QVEFRGGLGLGNRCVRADLPLPSTVLRERGGLGTKSHLARHPDTSPLALFRWLLAKMAATASGGGGGRGGGRRGVGGRGGGGGVGYGGGFGNVHAEQQQEEAGVGVGVEGWGGVGAGVGGQGGGEVGGGPWGERLERASSMPSAGGKGGCCRGEGGREKPLPRAMCFPVALGGGAFDVTPRLVSYFEVTISSPRVDPPHAIPDCVAIGLSEGSFPLQGKMPGWDSASYGYHSDDGGAFHDAGSMLFKCGPSFGPGDVVGCGLDYSGGDDCADIFFTLNGRCVQSLGAAFRGVRGSFYPTVGIDSACPVSINFGSEPFEFDLAAWLREGGQEAAARE
ncbi:unnamed protein product, partial [Laminaria digitata]